MLYPIDTLRVLQAGKVIYGHVTNKAVPCSILQEWRAGKLIQIAMMM